uniref:Uncharacterized protein n=1 Tax=Trichuris muris TaxID=70415 RepID=A0A5S6QDW0_TRIMR
MYAWLAVVTVSILISAPWTNGNTTTPKGCSSSDFQCLKELTSSGSSMQRAVSPVPANVTSANSTQLVQQVDDEERNELKRKLMAGFLIRRQLRVRALRKLKRACGFGQEERSAGRRKRILFVRRAKNSGVQKRED